MLWLQPYQQLLGQTLSLSFGKETSGKGWPDWLRPTQPPLEAPLCLPRQPDSLG